MLNAGTVSIKQEVKGVTQQQRVCRQSSLVSSTTAGKTQGMELRFQGFGNGAQFSDQKARKGKPITILKREPESQTDIRNVNKRRKFPTLPATQAPLQKTQTREHGPVGDGERIDYAMREIAETEQKPSLGKSNSTRMVGNEI